VTRASWFGTKPGTGWDFDLRGLWWLSEILSVARAVINPEDYTLRSMPWHCDRFENAINRYIS